MRGLISAATVALTLAVAPVAFAQGVGRGAAEGADRGAAAAGPVGGIVGGVVGGVAGGVGGLLGVDQRSGFRDYVVRERRSSYRYNGDVNVGVALPEAGVEYYDVPTDYGVRGYRYTVINGQTVLVDPQTRRIVQIID